MRNYFTAADEKEMAEQNEREAEREIVIEKARRDREQMIAEIRDQARFDAMRARAERQGENDETRARRANLMRAFGIENPKHASKLQQMAINDLRNAK